MSAAQLIRFRQVRQLQICTIAVLFLSLLASLFTADFQFTASPRGLQALAILTIIGNLVLCLVFGFFNCAWLQIQRCRMDRLGPTVLVQFLLQDSRLEAVHCIPSSQDLTEAVIWRTHAALRLHIIHHEPIN